MNKRLLISGVVVILVVVGIFVLVRNYDSGNYDYDVGTYSGMRMEVERVDGFGIMVDDDTMVVVYSLNSGEGLLSTIIRLGKDNVWRYWEGNKIMPRVYHSDWFPTDERAQRIIEVILATNSYFSRQSISLRGANQISLGVSTKTSP